MDATFTLTCWILGESPSHVFPVKITSASNVSDLKEAILNRRPSLVMDTSFLELYHPSEEVSKMSDEELETWDFEHARLLKFKSRRPLSAIFQSALDPEALHVIVQLHLTLHCVLHDHTGRVLRVEIPPSRHVSMLQELIKDRLPDAYSSVVPLDLILYHIPLSEDDELQKNLEAMDFSEYTALRSTSLLSQIFPMTPRANHIHIVVRLPQGQQKRKEHPIEEESYVNRIKKAKIVTIAPSVLAAPPYYEELQKDLKNRILDDRPSPDDVPPISLMYEGFGQFLDIFSGKTDVEGLHAVNIFELQRAVDKFSQLMCQFHPWEVNKREAGLAALNRIFAARTDGQSFILLPAAIGSTRTVGHCEIADGFAPVICEFKKWTPDTIPEVKVTGCFAQAFLRGVERSAEKNELSRWRFPGLGITIVGRDIKFYALLSLNTQFRLVSLTPSLSCIPSASEGWDRKALYRAFTAVSVLQARIKTESHQRQLFTGSFNDARLPSVSQLSQQTTDSKLGDPLEFQIQGKYISDNVDATGLLYKAKLKDSERVILVKFARQYSCELHNICAKAGHAPALLAYQCLPGGWHGVAMDFEADAVPITHHSHISEHLERWETDLNNLVLHFHDQGFVHGDLRDANILSGNHGTVKLVDFDWGGEEGNVWYPMPTLNHELLVGRVSEDLKITKGDDLRILKNTLAKVRRLAQATTAA